MYLYNVLLMHIWWAFKKKTCQSNNFNAALFVGSNMYIQKILYFIYFLDKLNN